MGAIPRYLVQRFPLGVFGPVAALLTTAALWSVDRTTGGGLSRTVVLCVSLLVLFRIWDDLQDREADGVAHPDRILPTVPVGPFHALCAVLALVATALCLDSPLALVALAATSAGLWASYRILRPQVSDLSWRFVVLPLKYPAVLCVAAFAIEIPSPARVVAAAATTYVCAVAYEYWHDAPTAHGVSR